MKVKYSLLTLSAVLLANSFLVPQWCAEGSMLFLIPLFYCIAYYRCSFKDGLLWGFVFNVLYLSGLLYFIIEHGQHFIKYIVAGILLGYSVLLSGVWFYVSDNAYIMIKTKRGEIRLLIWSVTTWLYFFFITKAYFIIAGVWEGNNLAMPLLPLVIRSYSHHLFMALHPQILFFGILLFAMSIVLYFITQNKYWLLLSLSIVIIFLVIPKNTNKKGSDIRIACGVLNRKYESVYKTAEAISNIIKEVSNNTYDMICFPESTCNFNLEDYPAMCAQWTEEFNGIVGVGAHSCNGGNAYYCIHKGLIMHRYEKNHLMPLTEYIPYLYSSFPLLCHLFIKEEFFVASSETKPILLLHDLKIQCFICSELFFDLIDIAIDMDCDCVVVAVNDSWFSLQYIPKLMLLYARLKAMQLKKTLIYTSYYYSLIVQPNGLLSYLSQYAENFSSS